MATISSLGVGSNLDLNSLLASLSTAESQPIVALQKQQSSYNAKLTAYGTLQGVLSSFQAAATKLADASLFQSVKAASSAADVLTATAGATASAGSYAVNVTQLAQSQSLAAAGKTNATDAVGLGTVTIDFGTISGGTLDAANGQYSGAAFAPDASRTAQSVVIDSSNNTLEGLRDAINKNTALGVTASIVNDGGVSPYRLVLNSTQTGAASSMRIVVTGDASLKTLLNQDSSGTQALRQTTAASNAALTVNGIGITSATNTVKDAAQGVTMTLGKMGLSNLTVNKDNTAVQSAVSAFVDAFNTLKGTASYLTKYDTATKTGSALVGDSTLRSVQTRIRDVLNTPQTGALQTLSKVGVTFSKDGTLEFDATKLNTAFAANSGDVAALFSGTTGGSTGFGKQIATLIDGYTGTNGKLTFATTGISTTLKSLATQQTAMQLSVDNKVAAYRKQFTQLDVIMSKMNATTSYLTAQFDAMNASNK